MACWMKRSNTVGMPRGRVFPSWLGDVHALDRLRAVAARFQLRADFQPVVSEVLWQFIDCHAVDARRAFVLAHLLQGALQVGPFQHCGRATCLSSNRLGLPLQSSDEFILRHWPQPACAGGQMRSRLSSSRSFVFHRSGLRPGPPDLLCPLLTSPRYSAPIAQRPASILRSTGEISRGKTRHFRCTRRRIYKMHPNRRWRASRSRARSPRMHHASYPVFVHRPAASDWASFRPRLADDALALLLAFGSAKTWLSDFHRHSYVPCPAHPKA